MNIVVNELVLLVEMYTGEIKDKKFRSTTKQPL